MSGQLGSFNLFATDIGKIAETLPIIERPYGQTVLRRQNDELYFCHIPPGKKIDFLDAQTLKTLPSDVIDNAILTPPTFQQLQDPICLERLNCAKKWEFWNNTANLSAITGNDLREEPKITPQDLTGSFDNARYHIPNQEKSDTNYRPRHVAAEEYTNE